VTHFESGALVALLVATVAGATSLLVQKFVLSKTREREREMHRAELAADAFAEFFAVIGRARTVKGALRDGTPNLPTINWTEEFVRVLDDLHAARGRLAAVVSSQIVEKLAALERTREGFSANSPDSVRELTEVMQLLRADLGVDGAVTFDDVRALLFGST
jgi:hypothetical protein